MGNARFRSRRRAAVVALASVLVAGACGDDDNEAGESTTSAPATDESVPATSETPVVTESRGYDGETLRVAGMGTAGNFAGADVGAQARFQRANETGELGYRIEYLEFADDQQDPARATSEARRLVTQEQVFAIVPDLSAVNPGPYLNEEHVPYVGQAYDSTYCSNSAEPDDTLYGFGFNGCLVPADPAVMPDSYGNLFAYVSELTGEDNPSIVLFSNDNQSGQNSTRFGSTAAAGAGFDVVYAEGSVPLTTSDYTPYVQEWLTADGGEQPDAIYCLLSVQCLQIWPAVQAAGFDGVFQTPLYTDLLLGPLAGTVANVFYNIEPNEGLEQMAADIEAFAPGTGITSTNAFAYFAADMFIQALRTVGTNVTPEAVQEALAHQTWEIPGLVGPIVYPDSTVAPTPACSMLVANQDGSAWVPVQPYNCSEETFEVS